MKFYLVAIAAVLVMTAFNYWLARKGGMGRVPMKASERIKLDLIDFEEHDGLSTDDGNAYLALGSDENDLAFAQMMGDGWVVRRLGPGQLKSVSLSGQELILTLADFTMPRVSFRLHKESDAEKWLGLFQRLVPPHHKQNTDLKNEASHGLA